MYSFYVVLKVSGPAVILTLLNVVLHFEALNLLSNAAEKIKRGGRARILFIVCGLILVHIVEIWLFALGIIIAKDEGSLGHISGAEDHQILDYVYYSAMCYTTVGFGDMLPLGALRFIAAIESLMGLTMISWSASFTYLEMRRFWHSSSPKKR